MIKRATKQLMTADSSKFSSKFEDNKKALGAISNLPSKPIRNKIAGYLARLKRMESTVKVKKVKPVEAPVDQYSRY